MRIAALSCALALTSCGGAPVPAEHPSGAAGDAERWTAQAAEAWSSLDPERAAMLADRAITLGAGDDAREIAARAQLALGHADRAEQALEGTSDPVLLRLRARAEMALGRFDAALATLEAARRHGDEDPWSEAVIGAVRAAASAEPYALEGAPEAELAMEDLPLPVVRVRVGPVETLALIGTSADLMVLDPALRDASGIVDELAVGALRMRDVPFVVRSLAPVRDALHAEVRAVIGAEVLLRTSATIDGPNRRFVVRAEPPVRDPTTSAPLLTPSGSFLVVPVRIDDAAAWMTLDTAGLFPVALAPGAEAALGLEGLAWRELDGGPSMAVVGELRIGELVVEQIPLVRGLLGEAHARAVEAPVAGSIGWGLLGQLTIGLDPRTRQLRFE